MLTEGFVGEDRTDPGQLGDVVGDDRDVDLAWCRVVQRRVQRRVHAVEAHQPGHRVGVDDIGDTSHPRFQRVGEQLDLRHGQGLGADLLMAEQDEVGEDGHGEKKEADKKDKGHGGGGHGDASPKSGSLTYYKFSREFVVPVISNKRVDSLVILNLNLEVDSAIADSLYPMDPKLRDNIMTTLVSLSNEGEAMVSITDPANYELIRATVLENLKQLVPEGLENVLILDMAKQHI